MLLLFGTIASVGINNMIKAKIDMNKSRNLVIASIILTVGHRRAVISFEKFSLAEYRTCIHRRRGTRTIIPDKEKDEARKRSRSR